ncbi:uncharacterized protein BX664DRAFT_336585 [Halteromyces radiatus]|uniref:uncharacterized protein n=1 Tax=Halteromyces radiatus TaxID=101107 RepID=UPI00221E3C42|nr:uncharacterized protein BX664DRAFT_336585 [Halteromyces radiatus]KAI8086713.1 hypothetical protein BX664DRAFT_336585 [Halteromyces radiatus]
MKSLPNELLMHVIDYIPSNHLSVFLFVCRYTHQLVSGKAYRKTMFPDDLPLSDIMNFCQKHGSSLVTIKLPHGKRYPDTFFMLLFQLCPNLNFLQSSMTPKQIQRFLFRTHYPLTCFMLTQHYDYGDDLDDLIGMTQDHYNVTKLSCCSSIFLFPHPPIPDTTLTHISHYFHHPGALRNAILPTFGPDLLSLTLNVYDILTLSVAEIISQKCPRLRYLQIPHVKAQGLWMLLHKCNTLVAIVVGGNETNQDSNDNNDWTINDDESNVHWINQENQKAVATIKSHKRVWCIHQQSSHSSDSNRLSWHIGILPKI